MSQICRSRCEIALRRHETAGGAGDRLDEARGDVLGAVQIDEPRKVIGEVGAVRALAGRVQVLLQVRVPHVHDAGDARTVLAPVVDDAGQRDAAEVDAVIRALARHEHRPARLSARLVVGERDLHRRVHRFRAGVDEEDVIEVARRELGDARRELEALRMRAQERGDEIEIAELPVHRLGDLLAAVAGGDAEQPRRCVDDLLAAIVPVVHPFGLTTIRGSALKSRFGVNGIHSSSSDSGFCVGWLRSVNSA